MYDAVACRTLTLYFRYILFPPSYALVHAGSGGDLPRSRRECGRVFRDPGFDQHRDEATLRFRREILRVLVRNVSRNGWQTLLRYGGAVWALKE